MLASNDDDATRREGREGSKQYNQMRFARKSRPALPHHLTTSNIEIFHKAPRTQTQNTTEMKNFLNDIDWQSTQSQPTR